MKPTALSLRARSGFRRLSALVIAAALICGFGQTLSAQPTNFQNELLLSGLNQPIDVEFLPDGRMLVLHKEGAILIADPAASPVVTSPYMTLTDIDVAGEHGLMSIVLDPNFSTNNFFYLYYINGSTLRGRISRFVHLGTNAQPSSEFVVWQSSFHDTDFHSGGGLDIGPDGKLYLGTGDDFSSQNAQDLTSSHGKVIRVNTDGTIPADNPFHDGLGPNLDSIWAYGLRNPFRAHWDAPTNRLLIAEVGGNVQSIASEDVHLGRAGANYGWPLCEGPSGNPSYPNCDPVLHDNPIFWYPHLGAGASIAGGVVYRGTQFPSNFAGAYFFGDYVREFIRYVTFDSSGTVATGDFPFVASAGLVVSIKQSPLGSLYYVDIAGSVRRISYTGSNQAPVITSAQADTTSGFAPLTVHFTGAATDTDPLTYRWLFGDGTEAFGANPTHAYLNNGLYSPRLEVSDGELTTLSNPIFITVGSPPNVAITTPSPGAPFRAGDTINFSGTAFDPDGTLGPANYTWRVRFVHNEHTHPAHGPVTGTSGSFQIPTAGHHFSDETGYQIILTVTDSDGLVGTASVTIFPEKVDLSFNTSPSGLTLLIDGDPRVTPFVLDTLIGYNHTISASSPQCFLSGQALFGSWSDGGAQTHGIVVPAFDQSRTATFILTGNACGTPAITSAPQTAAAVGAKYVYPVVAVDPENPPSPLTFSLAAHPTGMTINASTGLIQWTPVAGDVATSPHDVTIVVSDGSLQGTQTFEVTVTPADAWWDSAWQRRVRLTTNLTGIPTNLTGFPVLVVLDPTRIDYSMAGAGGRDLRFVADDNDTVLPHEIERWVPGGASYVWVRVPWLTGGGAVTQFWIYYGNSGALDEQDAAALWTGYRAVWHLNDATDDSGQGHHGTDEGTLDEVGQIGRGRRVGGVTIQVPHATPLSFGVTDSYTLSAWVKVEALLSRTTGVVVKARESDAWYGIGITASNRWFAHGPTLVAGTTPAIGWSHVAIVQDGAAGLRRLYVNGVLQATGAAAEASGTGNFVIGGMNGTVWDFSGVLDEVRLSGAVTSRDWLEAAHRFESNSSITYEAVPAPGGNQPPVITSTAVTTATEGVAYSYDVAASDDGLPQPPGGLTYSLTQNPAGMTIEGTTGLIAWTPGAGTAAASPHGVTVRVSDGALFTSQSFNITVSPSSGGPGWWDLTWTQRSRLTLDTTGLTSNLTGFPLLVVLTPARIDYPSVGANGADLRFIADDQATVLAHEIEQWVPGGTSYVWVRVPTVVGGGTATRVWLYYGKPGVADGQNAAALWAGQRAVWHLNDATDDSGQGHHGTDEGTLDEVGQIGRGRRVGGVTIQVPHAAALSFGVTDSYTLSAWVKVEGVVSRTTGVVVKSRDSAPWYGIGITSSNRWFVHGPPLVTGGTTALGWSHVAIVQDGAAGQRRLYVNGILQATGAAAAASGTGNFVIGGMNGAAWDFAGALDEVRLSGTVTSGDWLRATHRFETNTSITYEAVPAPGGNQPPVITSTAVTTATEGVAYSYDVAASDDGLPQPPGGLTYSLTQNPAGMTIEGTTGLIAWTPGAGTAAASPHGVTVRVSDGALAASQSFNITVSPSSGGPGWWDLTWTQRSRLTLDTTGLTSNLTGFPLLVVLTPARIDYPSVGANGADLRFIADDQATVLAHEIEQWVPGGTSYVWVRVPTVVGGGTATRVWLYYGKPGVADGQNAAALWAGQRAVWHLNDATDDSGQGHHGTDEGTLDEVGQIGRGRRVGGVTIQVPHASALSFGVTDSYTLSAWVKVEGVVSRTTGVVVKSRDSAPWYGIGITSSNRWFVHGPPLVTGGTTALGWSHVAIVQDGAAGLRRLYVNGVLQATGAAAAASGTGNFVIGGMNGAAWDFAGALDEVRLSGTVTSGDWLRATHRFESNTSITYEAVPAPGGNQPPVITSTAVTTATEGVAYSYDVAASDDGLPQPPGGLTYSLTQNPAGMTIEGTTGLIAWTPGVGTAAASPHGVTVQVSDGALSATQSFNITVSPRTGGPWWDLTWTQRVRLTLDTTGLTSNLTGFPLLVVLTPARIDYASVGVNGADLRFVAADQTTVLAHEIEQWVPGGTSYVWVRVPTVVGGGWTTRVWLYYGKPGVADGQNAAALWAGHRAVWHLDGNGTVDASGQGHTGLNQGSVAEPGKIGNGQHFQGYEIEVPHSSTLSFSATDSFTLSTWVRLLTLQSRTTGIVTKSRDSAPWYGIGLTSSNRWYALGPTLLQAGPAAVGWSHVVVVQDGATGQRRIYVNGVLGATGAAQNGTGTGNFVIGGQNGALWDHAGWLDEVRLSPTAASADWITAMYRFESDAFILYEDVLLIESTSQTK